MSGVIRAGIPSAALRPTPDLRNRATLATLALLPAVVAAWMGHDATAAIAATPAVVMILLDRMPAQAPVAGTVPFFQQFLVLSLWLGTDAIAARVVAALALLLLHLAWRGRDQANPFHPVMASCALALAFVPASPIAVVHPGDVLPRAAAIALGGVGLLALRCVRWQAPLGMLAGATFATAVAAWVDPSWLRSGAFLAILPAFVLTAFFVADDPPRTCMRGQGRLLVWLLAGCVAAAAMFALHATGRDARLPLALAGSVLLANAAAPAFDRLFQARRVAGTPAA